MGLLGFNSLVEKDSLKNLIGLFTDEKIGAVISIIKVGEITNIYEKIQRLEYIISNFIRRLMSKIDGPRLLSSKKALHSSRFAWQKFKHFYR